MGAEVNPDEPPTPAKVHDDEARNVALSFLKVTPRRATIVFFQDQIDRLKS